MDDVGRREPWLYGSFLGFVSTFLGLGVIVAVLLAHFTQDNSISFRMKGLVVFAVFFTMVCVLLQGALLALGW